MVGMESIENKRRTTERVIAKLVIAEVAKRMRRACFRA
jgi:hypothetical protein